MKTRSIGLIGGNGSYASVFFYKLLLDKSRELYGARNNDDFPKIIIDSVPVPDFISETDSLKIAKKILVESAKRLDRMGCTEISVVCNTIHILESELNDATSGKFVSMIDLVTDKARNIGLKRVGLLASPTTVRSEIYAKSLKEKEIIMFNENEDIQLVHAQIIREVIGGRIKKSQTDLLGKLVKNFIKNEKLDGIILGCTELPLVFPKGKIANTIDCLDVLADELLLRYYIIGSKYEQS